MSTEPEMKLTDPEKPNGFEYTREDGTEIFVHDLGSLNDGSGRDPELAGQYDVYVGGYRDGEPDGQITAPEPLPYPLALRDLTEQFLDAQ